MLLLLATSTWADERILIETASNKSLAGHLGCPKQTSRQTMNVRIQSLKTSLGTIFHRKTIAADLFECFEAAGKKTLAATNIKLCAKATEAAGFQMYRWTNGNCTGYVQGIAKKTNCTTNGTVVLYSVDAALGPAAYTLSLHHSVSSIYAKWAACHPDYPAKPVTKFKLTWNGTTIDISGTTYEHRFKSLDLCNSDLSGVDFGLKNVTLAAFDGTDNLMMKPVTETVTDNYPTDETRYALKSKNCIFYLDHGGRTKSYDFEVAFCRKRFGTLFSEHADGDLATYMDDLATLKADNPLMADTYSFVDLKCVQGTSKYKWLGGREEDIEDSIWAAGSDSSKCCATTISGGGSQLTTAVCDIIAVNAVCHEFVA